MNNNPGLKILCTANAAVKLGRIFNLPVPKFDEQLSGVKEFVDNISRDQLDDFPVLQERLKEAYGSSDESIEGRKPSGGRWWWAWLRGETQCSSSDAPSALSGGRNESIFRRFFVNKRKETSSLSSGSNYDAMRGGQAIADENEMIFLSDKADTLEKKKNTVMSSEVGYCAREFGLWLMRNDPMNRWGGLSRRLADTAGTNDVFFACKECVLKNASIK